METMSAEETGALQVQPATRHELAQSGTAPQVDSALQQGDEKLFEMLMLGSSVDVAAVTAGVSRRTAYRRLGDPVFRQRLEQARASVRDSIVQRIDRRDRQRHRAPVGNDRARR